MQAMFETNDRQLKHEIQQMQNSYAQELQQAQDKEVISAQELNLQYMVAENRMNSTIASLRTHLTESQARERYLQSQRPVAEPERPTATRPILSPISMATPSNRARSPHLPDVVSGIARGDSGAGNDRRVPEAPPYGIARGDPGVESRSSMPKAQVSGFARGDPGMENRTSVPPAPVSGIAGGDSGVKREPFSHEASNPGAARGDPSGDGPYVPDPTVPKEEKPEQFFTTSRFRRSEPCPASTPLRARDPCVMETERATPGLTSMNIYKESQTMTFLNWPDMRGFEAWKSHFHREVASKSNEPKRGPIMVTRDRFS